MTRARNVASFFAEGESSGRMVVNEDVFEGNLTVVANTNALVAGPVTIPNVTVAATANLQIAEELNVTTQLSVSGNLNILS